MYGFFCRIWWRRLTDCLRILTGFGGGGVRIVCVFTGCKGGGLRMAYGFLSDLGEEAYRLLTDFYRM